MGYRKAWKEAREYFGIMGDTSKVMHHKDKTLRHTDLKRYLEWRPEDLVVMDRGEHTRGHCKGISIVRSQESIEKQRATITGRKKPEHSLRMQGAGNPMYGVKRPEVSKRNTELKKGKPNPGVAERWRKYREAKGLIDNSNK